MSTRNRGVLVFFTVGFLLISLPAFLRFFVTEHEIAIHFLRQLFIFPIYVLLTVLWAMSLHHRIMQRNIMVYLLSICGLMLFWIVLRTVRYEVLYDKEWFSRLLWYAFYIPMTLIPLLSVLAVQCMGNDEFRKPHRWALYLFIPSTILIIGILTNDLHQFAFQFLESPIVSESNYRRGWLYYLIAAWIVVLLIVFFVLLIKKSKVPGTKRWLILPLVFVVGGLIYAVLYNMNLFKEFVRFYDLTVTFCFLVACMWESCIQVGLIPNNTKYNSLFTKSSIRAQILDENCDVVFASAGAPRLDQNTLKQIPRMEDISISDDEIIHVSKIDGGFAVWHEDVSQIRSLNEELIDTHAFLSENNVLIQREIETRAEESKQREKKRLYESITKTLAAPIQELDRQIALIEHSDNVAASREAYWKVLYLTTYMKRRGNLMLIAEERETVSSQELQLCIMECKSSLELARIHIEDTYCHNEQIPVTAIYTCFDQFHDFVWKNFQPGASFQMSFSMDGALPKFDIIGGAQ